MSRVVIYILSSIIFLSFEVLFIVIHPSTHPFHISMSPLPKYIPPKILGTIWPLCVTQTSLTFQRFIYTPPSWNTASIFMYSITHTIIICAIVGLDTGRRISINMILCQISQKSRKPLCSIILDPTVSLPQPHIIL